MAAPNPSQSRLRGALLAVTCVAAGILLLAPSAPSNNTPSLTSSELLSNQVIHASSASLDLQSQFVPFLLGIKRKLGEEEPTLCDSSAATSLQDSANLLVGEESILTIQTLLGLVGGTWSLISAETPAATASPPSSIFIPVLGHFSSINYYAAGKCPSSVSSHTESDKSSNISSVTFQYAQGWVQTHEHYSHNAPASNSIQSSASFIFLQKQQQESSSTSSSSSSSNSILLSVLIPYWNTSSNALLPPPDAFIHPFSTVPPQVQLFHTQFLIKSTALVKSSTTSSSSTTDHEPPTSSSSTSSSQNMVKIPLNSLNDMMDYYLSSSSAHDGTECTAIPYHYVFEMLPDIKASSTGTARLLNTTYYQVCSNGSISSSVSNCFNRSTPSYSEYRIFSHAKKVKKMQRYAVATIIYSTLPILLLLFHQIKTTRNSQPALFKVSIYTLGIMIINDAFNCLAALTIAISSNTINNNSANQIFFSTPSNTLDTSSTSPVFIPFALLSFLNFILFAIFEMRYLLAVVKANNRGWSDQVSLRVLYTRFYLYPFIFFFLFYNLIASSTLLTALFTLLSHSYWLPQIYMNATRNTRKALSWRFVMGTSVARILDSLYPYLCPWGMYSGSDGGINAGTSVGWWNVGVALILVSWLGIQCLGLYLQQVYGARCFVPYWMLPSVYNYHRLITRSDDDAVLYESLIPTHSPTANNTTNSTSLSTPAVLAVSSSSHQHTDDRDLERGIDDLSDQAHLLAPPLPPPVLSSSTTTSECTTDCAICAESVAVLVDTRPPLPSSASSPPALVIDRQNMLSSGISWIRQQFRHVITNTTSKMISYTYISTTISTRHYMVTPCHHVFHTECLERWMEQKLECPTCRAQLPPQ